MAYQRRVWLTWFALLGTASVACGGGDVPVVGGSADGDGTADDTGTTNGGLTSTSANGMTEGMGGTATSGGLDSTGPGDDDDDDATSTGPDDDDDDATSTGPDDDDDDDSTGSSGGSSGSSSTGPSEMCGDGVAEGSEDCDMGDLAGEDCISQGFDAGTLDCAGDCTFDTSGCATFMCGNDTIEGTEICDGSDLSGEDCLSQGFDAGTLDCLGDCSDYDTSGCVTFMCGNDTIEGTEICDGTDLAGEDCSSQGFDSGVLDCAGDCSGYDTSGCIAFSGACCVSNGTPGCDDAGCTAAICAADPFCCATGWDATCGAAAIAEPACQGLPGCPTCGDDTAEGTELCDGTDLAGEDCTTLGFSSGALGCSMDCSAYDTSMCIDYMGDCCADNNTPGCDDPVCTAAICGVDPFCCDTEWDGICGATAFNAPECQGVGGSCPTCGDDNAEGPEVCDGTDVGGLDCTDFGFDGGTLGCEPDCSGPDLTFCVDEGFGDCVNNPPGAVCLPNEQCITDLAMPPTQGVCADVDCTDVAECPLAPPGGTAPVQCIDITGEGINECILFCGLGQTCPTGMICALGIACAWPAN